MNLGETILSMLPAGASVKITVGGDSVFGDDPTLYIRVANGGYRTQQAIPVWVIQEAKTDVVANAIRECLDELKSWCNAD